MRKRLLLLIVPVLIALALAQPATAFNPQPEPPGFQALIDDINSLSLQNPRPLLAMAEAAASSTARGHLCPATHQLNALANFIAVKTGATIAPREADLLMGDIATVMRLNQFPPGPARPC